jgi:hypothetical protein
MNCPVYAEVGKTVRDDSMGSLRVSEVISAKLLLQSDLLIMRLL